MDKLMSFKAELRELLIKYNACIDYEYEGEGYSICNQQMVIYAGGKCETICEGTEIDMYSIAGTW